MPHIVRLLHLLLMSLPCVALMAAHPSDSIISETFAIKTNLLYDAGGVPSLGIEFPVSRSGRWTLDVSGTYNPIRASGPEFWKNWMVQPEIRYNFGHHTGRPKGITYFWAAHLMGGQYNLQRTPWLKEIWKDLNDWRFQGWGIGAGTGIGVRFNFSRHFGVEIEAAAGYIYSRYNRYRCGNCGERTGRGTKHYVGPTKAAVNFLFRLFAPAGKRVEIIDAWPEGRDIGIRDTVIVERSVTDTVVVRDTLPGDTLVIPPAVRRDRISLRLDFEVNGSRIERDRGDNSAALDSLCRFIDRYRNDMGLRIQTINVCGFSSVEGDAAYNLRLSGKRADAVARYIGEAYPALAPLVESSGFGEDWDSLDFPDKQRIMDIPDLDARQAELMKMDGGRVYRELMRSAVPGTRRTEVSIDYTVIDNIINNHSN